MRLPAGGRRDRRVETTTLEREAEASAEEDGAFARRKASCPNWHSSAGAGVAIQALYGVPAGVGAGP